MSEKTTIAVAYGDGIGPEIMEATLKILDAAGAQLNYERVKIGKEVYLSGMESGIDPSAWDVFRKHKVFLKSPITTPQGGGYKSLNVTIRKTLGLFANVRPSKAYAPYVKTHFPDMDLVIVRENEEDLYAGIEYQQTSETVACLKLVSKPACESIVRYAFEYAKAYGRKKVTCMSKDNIMKLTDGLFHKIFDEVAKEYPEIENDHYIIDIGSALLASRPNWFDVIVTLNLYGDIISDITAQVAGSVGLGGSSNIGENFAMFEAIHGSAPDIAGKGIANPSGLLNAACMLLVHVGQSTVAEKIQNAWLRTLEDGIHTGDIYNAGLSVERVGTTAFADALIERLGQEPQKLASVHYNPNVKPIKVGRKSYAAVDKKLSGVDVFLDWVGSDKKRNPNELGAALSAFNTAKLQLKIISNRGQKVYPDGQPETFCADNWRCRFVSPSGEIVYADVIALLETLNSEGYNIGKTENLYMIDGKLGYTLSQGE